IANNGHDNLEPGSMSLLRKALWLFILAITAFTVIVPMVGAQTSSITSLHVGYAAAGTDVTVTVAATYNLGTTAYGISIGILNMPSVPHGWAKGTATSSQNTCHENRINAGLAYCAYIPTSASGSDVVTFN